MRRWFYYFLDNGGAAGTVRRIGGQIKRLGKAMARIGDNLETVGIEAVCMHCRVTVQVPWEITSDMQPDSPACWDALEAGCNKTKVGFVVRETVQVRGKSEAGDRIFLCPTCFKKYQLTLIGEADPNLRPYRADPICAKCGFNDVDIRYCIGWPDSGCAAVEQAITSEHIHHECRRCHYRWETATADAKLSGKRKESHAGISAS